MKWMYIEYTLLSAVTCVFLLNKLEYCAGTGVFHVVNDGRVMSCLDSCNFDILWPVPHYVPALFVITVKMLVS
jgi:hypothetical protein